MTTPNKPETPAAAAAAGHYFVCTIRCNALYRRETKDDAGKVTGAVYEVCGRPAPYVKIDTSPRGKVRVNVQFRCGAHLEVPEGQEGKELYPLHELWDASLREPKRRRGS